MRLRYAVTRYSQASPLARHHTVISAHMTGRRYLSRIITAHAVLLVNRAIRPPAAGSA